RLLQRSGHGRIVRGSVRVAELPLSRRLRLLEPRLLRGLELEPGVGEQPVRDPGQVRRAGSVVLDEAQARIRGERVRHHLLKAELEAVRDRALEPFARLLVMTRS